MKKNLPCIPGGMCLVQKSPSAFHRKNPSFRVSSIKPEHLDKYNFGSNPESIELPQFRKPVSRISFTTSLLLYENPLVMVGYGGVVYLPTGCCTPTPIHVQKKPGRVHC